MSRRHVNWQRPPSCTKTFPVETRQIGDRRAYRVAYAAALEAAGGDHRRIVIEDDGSMTVANEPVDKRQS